jgi:predicted DNA-binding transcriptional regulator YafY
LLTELGFDLDKDIFGRYELKGSMMGDTPALTVEELEFMKKLLLTQSASKVLAKSILDKLSLHGQLTEVPEAVAGSRLSLMIERILQAKESGKQLKLKGYLSASSQTVKDRLVEPIKLSEDFAFLQAFEPESGENKVFLLQRMSDVKILESNIAHQAQHVYSRPDVFGFIPSDEPQDLIELELNLRAYLILSQEYPSSLRHVKRINDQKWSFEAPVYSFKAPVRFVMGLAEDVKITGSEAFKAYVRDKLLGLLGVELEV